jgi:ABC-2 type transport system ATP-binding protein
MRVDTSPSILIEALSKHFVGANGVVTQALDQVSTQMRAGAITGLVGPDGAGKTTLLRLLAGLLHPSAGAASILGLNAFEKADDLREQIGYMPQKFGLYEDLTVLENLTLYADLRHVVGEERVRSFERLLHFTGLSPFTARYAGQLSGGMKQKLGLACTLLGTPRVLLLDEPGVGVDPISRRELWRMVRELVQGGMTVVWSTAYLDEAELCDEVHLMNSGRILASGAPQTLMEGMRQHCWLLTRMHTHKRLLLQRILQYPQVMDAVIQGHGVRVVLKDGTSLPDLVALDAGPEAQWQPAAPRLEDAFITRLGGVHGRESVLAQVMPEVVLPRSVDPLAVIEARQLTRRFGDFVATDAVSFRVERGEIFGLLGPNGAGKSTTFKMECGLLKPSEGQALVMGLDLKTSPTQARQQLGYMAQKFSLYKQLTVRQNLAFFSGIYGLRGRAQTDKVAQMVAVFALAPHLDDVADTLPLGFKQRLALACAVMHHPPLLFLDEPTSGVDPLTRREFWMHINGLADKGVTTMVTTHFMDEAEYCDRVALIYRGQMIALGTPDELKARVVSADKPNPTMEDAFIGLVLKADQDHG